MNAATCKRCNYTTTVPATLVGTHCPNCQAPYTSAAVPGIYRHYKGGLYRLLFIASESTNMRKDFGPVAVYLSLTTGAFHTRDLGEFLGNVTVPGDSRPCPRFQLVNEPLAIPAAGL